MDYDSDYYPAGTTGIRADEDEEGCIFGDKCCMPGPHTKSECHTAEMIEDFNRERQNEQKRPAWIVRKRRRPE